MRDLTNRLGPHLRDAISSRVNAASTADEFRAGLAELVVETKQRMEELASRETEESLSAFAGETRLTPAYVEWLIAKLGEVAFLHLEERKQPIGREEAQTLLQLKVRRRGPDRLFTIQQTIRGLLGVTVDAFEPEAPEGRHIERERGAEMDVDDFLVEANGAGIRESLRLILDLELKKPELVLIEEPEVHLHPGLSQVVARYLREKSADIQLFVTTHSTDYVDSAFFKNVYLIHRNHEGKTASELVEGDDAITRIPAELGLRPSTLFMFDRLVFVEGASDEAVFREIARKLEIDLAKSNVGFVHMGGVRNFAHFSVEVTLDIFSRRRILLWFVADRDERDDAEVTRMMDRLGKRARLVVLKKRELENYLLEPFAITQLIKEKQTHARRMSASVDVDAVRKVLQEELNKLKQEVIRLRLDRIALGPVFLHTRENTGTVDDRLSKGMEKLRRRIETLPDVRAQIEKMTEDEWEKAALNLAPGSTLLANVAARFEVTFSKHTGDNERLARLQTVDSIDTELRELLEDVTRK